MSTLEAALQQFEATEANLEKLEKKLWEKISPHISGGPAFGAPPMSYALRSGGSCLRCQLLAEDGWKITPLRIRRSWTDAA
jgi:hypothetical protein